MNAVIQAVLLEKSVSDDTDAGLLVNLFTDGGVLLEQGPDTVSLSAAETAVIRDGLINAMPAAEKVKLRDRLLVELGPLVR